jgi:hypothetical protein
MVGGATNQFRAKWATARCTSCGGVVLAQGEHNDERVNFPIAAIFPNVRKAHDDIPDLPRAFLQQAFDTLHAPDAAGVMAASAIDAMLKHLGYEDGSLYARIEKAVENGILTKGMSEWAHSVRLGANRPRHADKDNPRLSTEEARRAVEYAEALGDFLFVLTAQINKGIEAAKDASD